MITSRQAKALRILLSSNIDLWETPISESEDSVYRYLSTHDYVLIIDDHRYYDTYGTSEERWIQITEKGRVALQERNERNAMFLVPLIANIILSLTAIVISVISIVGCEISQVP